MGYKGLEVEYNYDFSQTVPDTDEDMMYYNSFKETFGEDGNVFAIGLKHFYQLSTQCQSIKSKK